MCEIAKKILDFILGPYGLLILSVLILLIGRFVFKKKYLNCFDIIKKHLECFVNAKGKISFLSILLYFGVPLLISIALVEIRNIDEEVINLLTIIVSILTAMFFTLLTLILDMRGKVKENTNYNAGDANISLKILKETYYSIMFEILVSIVILIMCFVELFAKQFYSVCGLVLYYLCFVMLTNLFMILKRIYRVIDKDIENS